MKLSLKQAVSKFPIGTRVRWSREFLRNIADYSRESAQRTGTITGPPKTYSPTFHILPIKWDDEQEAGSVNASNLTVESKLHLEPA